MADSPPGCSAGNAISRLCRRLLLGACGALLFDGLAASQDPQTIDLTNYSSPLSENHLPVHWQMFSFPSIKKMTLYDMVTDPAYGPVIRARSEGGAGGLIRHISEDPKDYPLLTWTWKIEDIISRSSLGNSSDDDFPVRLMVTFETSGLAADSRDNTLCYVWSSREPAGTMGSNPRHANVVTIVAVSGADQAGTWQQFSANIVEDYLLAFGEYPGKLKTIALMTDSDDTGGRAQAWYGPVLLNRAPVRND